MTGDGVAQPGADGDAGRAGPELAGSSALSPLQMAALDALVGGARSIKEAAEMAGCGERSIRRWLSLPTFAAELRAARAQALAATALRLQSVAERAVDELEAVLKGGARAADKVAAARAVLEHAQRFASDDIEERLVRIEALLTEVAS